MMGIFLFRSSFTSRSSILIGLNSSVKSSLTSCLSCAALMRSLIVLTFSEVTWTNFAPYNFWSPTSSQHKGVLHLLPYKALYGAIPIMAWWLLLYVNFTNAMCSSQFPPNSSTHARNRSSKTYYGMLSPRHVVCSAKVERWTWDLDLIQWTLESHGVVPPRLCRS